MPTGIYVRKKHPMNEFKKGHIVTEEMRRKIGLGNKGKKHSEEQNRKNSLSKKGTHLSKETKLKISIALKGKNTWSKGKHLSEETKKKMSLSNKIAQNRPERKEQQRLYMKGRHHTNEAKRKISITRKKLYFGEKHNCWKGGITPITHKIRASEKYQEWRQRVFIRDNFICQKCKMKGIYLHAHHIKSFAKLIEEVKNYLPLFSLYDGAMLYSPLWDIDNGITLCKKCHPKKERREER